ncbi:MAG: riboflavin synthase subunit alpha [Endozoicomonadaceae bacterium]|nr:riboflavin synthase subunit alpha [Endozoicomonadaceae bacterium]
MFTGLAQGTGMIDDIVRHAECMKLSISFPPSLIHHLAVGASVAVNGCCLTVTKISECCVQFDVIRETLLRTNLNQLAVRQLVNLERSTRVGDEIGGHVLSGHIMTTVPIMNRLNYENFTILTLYLPENIEKYLFYKGYIAIDGMSLTVSNCFTDTFEVHIIPETQSKTIACQYDKNQMVNIEIDTHTQRIVDTVIAILKKNKKLGFD